MLCKSDKQASDNKVQHDQLPEVLDRQTAIGTTAGNAGKLRCGLVKFKEVVDTMPCSLLRKVLKDLGVDTKTIDILDRPDACGSAAFRVAAARVAVGGAS